MNDHVILLFTSQQQKIEFERIIEIYLRAVRICSCEHFQEEEMYIKNTFKSLHYLEHFMRNTKRKSYRKYNAEIGNIKKEHK